ncbi:hypothetical protein GCM10027321_33990 [Massilia terrae]|uniref:Transmembrane protein n=1 Tax=Massilia terrae TaxID=1811224 RepID=A0ABT2CW91_9BURK|nr:hypothetical protein [Massilia terrae]MCS0658090.1 hypothetical protein [Massilia terrae]
MAPLIYPVALLLLFEDWCWDVGGRIAAAIGAWPPLRGFEAWVCRLPPYVALVAFVLPGLLLFPVKILALLAIAHGHAWSGILTLLVAKLGGAAVVARLYVLALPQLLSLAWFARLHAWFMRLKERSLAYLRTSGTWRRARRLAQDVRRRLRRTMRRLRPDPRGSRWWRALRRFVMLWRARRRKSTESERL